MKRFRILALLLALALCLTACGSGASSSAPSSIGGGASSADTDGEAVLPAEAVEDVVAYLTDGAYNKDSVVATVGDTPVTAAEVLYWIAFQQYYMTYYYYMNNGYTFSMSDDMGDGTTVGESLYQFGLDTALAYAVGSQKAHELGVTLSEENAAALETLYADNVASYGQDRWQAYLDAGLIAEEDFTEEQKAAWIQEHGEEFYQHSLMYYGSTPDAYAALHSSFYYFTALQDHLFGEGGEYEPTDATMGDYMDTYIADNGVIWARCILFSTMDCADDAAVAEVQAQAQAAYEELSALTGDELTQAFTDKQTEFDKSGYTAGEIQYFTNSDSLVEGYYEGLETLEVGQIGITDQTYYGYFILLREPNQPDSIADTVKAEYMSNTYQALIDQWTEEYGTECAMPDLDLDAFYTRLAELQQTLASIDTLPANEAAE